MRKRRAKWALGSAAAALWTLAAGGVLLFPPVQTSYAVSPNVERFASLSFGDTVKASSALVAAGIPAGGVPPLHAPDVPPVTVSQYRTPNGWLLRPAGVQVVTPRAPTGVTVSPDHNTVYVVNSGIFDEQLETVDAKTLVPTFTPATDLYMGVAADASGNVWASGGNRNRVFSFLAKGPVAVGTRHVGLVPGTPNLGIPAVGYPGNMVLGGDGRLFVAGNLSVPQNVIQRTDSSAGPCPDGAPANQPICSVINVIDVSHPTALSPQVHLVPVGRDAYGLAFNAAAKTLYVSNWADETNPRRANGTGTVSVLDVSHAGGEREVQVVPVGHHPTGVALSPDGRVLAVANSSDDTISLLTLDNTGHVTRNRVFNVKPTDDAQRGATPLAVTFSPDGKFLFVGLAGENAVEVRTASGEAIPRHVRIGTGVNAVSLQVPHTYIPVGWYPSALAAAPDPTSSGTRLYVTNLKGMGAGPGLNGQIEPLMGVRTEGTLSVITLPSDPDALDWAFNVWTAVVVENNRWLSLFDRATREAASDPCLPAPLPGGGTVFSQILCDASRGKVDARTLHVVYIIKENKTFDEYFGDIKPSLPDADASPAWLLFGENVTTNQHRLARTFNLSDNFWADSEQSTTGHSWTSAGYANEYNEITWNTEYDQGLRGDRWDGQYDGQLVGTSADGDVADEEGTMIQPQKRLVDLLADPATNPQRLTYRIYSDDVNKNAPALAEQVPLGLWGIGPSAVNHGRSLDFPDTDRANMFLYGHTISNAWSIDKGLPPASFGKEITFSPADQKRFVFSEWVKQYQTCRSQGLDDAACQPAMPNFVYMALPDDHTLGFNPMSPTPQSMVADNDYATGLIIQAISHSPFWKNTLVFIVEDDTQIGGDHVDAHRTFLLTAGGLAREWGLQGKVNHQAGSFPSVLKTIEVLFRLPPLTQYDKEAVPLHGVIVPSFKDANNTPYTAVRPPTPFLRNPSGTELAILSSKLDFSEVDRVNPQLLTDLLYHGLRGRAIPKTDWPLWDKPAD